MKNLFKLFVLVSALSSVAYAGGGGAMHQRDSFWYIGGQLGFAQSHWDSFLTNGEHSKVGKKDDFGARVHVGYQWNQYFAGEFGYTYLPSSVNVEVFNTPANAYDNYSKIKNWAFDLSGKVMAPLFDQFGLFTRLGISYLVSDVRDPLYTAYAGALKSKIRNFNATVGAGAYYDYSDKLRFTGEWQRFYGNSKAFGATATQMASGRNDRQPFMDLYTLGVSLRLPEHLLLA